jgi:hypothetical protein
LDPCGQGASPRLSCAFDSVALGIERAGGPMVNFQPVPKQQGKARVHLDPVTDHLDAATMRVAAVGGPGDGERHDYSESSVVVLTDPEGTESCLVAYSRPRA